MAIFRALDGIKLRLDGVQEFIRSFDVAVGDLVNLEVRQKGLDGIVREFTEEKNRLYPLLKEDMIENFQLSCERFYNLAFDVESELLSKLSLMKTPKEPKDELSHSFSAEVVAKPAVKLPDIPLPTFSGKYDEWLGFRQQFEAVVKRNEKLSDSEKLNYLRGCLKGDAVRDYGEDETSFILLWNALVKVFENKRWLVSKHLRDIFAQKQLSSATVDGLNGLLLSVQRHLRALRSVKLEQNTLSESILIEFLSSKLDPDTQKDWESALSLRPATTVDELPTWDEFVNFITGRVRMLQRFTIGQKSSSSQSQSRSKFTGHNNGRQNPAPVSHFVSKREPARGIQCFLCRTSHYLSRCPSFQQMSTADKFKTVDRLSLCRNCLSNKHQLSQCTSTSSCRHCQGKHHSSLHTGPVPGSQVQSTPESSSQTAPVSNIAVSGNDIQATQKSFSPFPNIDLSSPPNIAGLGEDFEGHVAGETLLSSSSKPSKQILLNTAMIYVTNVQGKPTKVRALLDSCAMSNFMTQACAKRLGLRRRRANTSVGGICGTSHTIKDALVATVCNQSKSYTSPVDCFVVDRITSDLPLSSFETTTWKIPSNVVLADPSFNVTGPIDVMIGQEHWNDIFLEGSVKLGDGLPTLRSTVFGWVVGGRVDTPSGSAPVNCLVTNEQLDERLRLFWEDPEETEFVPDSVLVIEDWFLKTHHRTPEARYIVQLPFKLDKSLLGDSRSIALRQFRSLEGRLSRNANLRQAYVQFLDQYKDLGHMEFFCWLKDLPENFTGYFIPHHPVFRPESTTTPLRVVFNGSAATKSGYSLNDLLDIGHVVQRTLVDIVLRFRFHRFAMSADVPKMYRQILVDMQDRCYQLIVWRETPTQEIAVFRLNTVTYGTSCAPYLATRALKQLCLDSSSTFPKASAAGLSDFYVDDLLTGADSAEELMKLADQFIAMMRTGGFDLHKISSSSNLLAGGAAVEQHEKFITNDSVIKTLGLTWQPQSDLFVVTAKNLTFSTDPPTKRTLFSDSAKLFDPIGLIAPVTVTVKCLMQEVWKEKIDWDAPLPSTIERKWIDFRTKLHDMPDVTLKRCVLPTESAESIQLIGFCDASQKAYGAVVYVRSVTRDRTMVNLLCSKSRIAPLAKSTIPRLELSSLLLLAQLIKSVKASLPFNITDTILFSDSTIAIAWAKADITRLKMYVGNRVQKIRKLVDVSDLLHVDTRNNAADIVSRGLMPDEINNCTMWFHGPAFLLKSMSEWPVNTGTVQLTDLPELMPSLVTVKDAQPTFILFQRVSSFRKMVRVMRRARQFVQRHIAPSLVLSTDDEPPTADDLRMSLRTIVRLVQNEAFPDEIHSLRSGQVCTNKTLLTLSPFLDEFGVMRVGGRLKNASMSFELKHQSVLPAVHPFTIALIRAYHEENGHAGPNLTLATLMRDFWIVNGKNAVRKVTRSCVRCYKVSPKTTSQLMGHYPAFRVQADHTSAFLKVGVDYAGPFYIKQRNKRSIVEYKGYICLFVCASVKAVHLELVGDLTTASFLAALDRFVSRRGKPDLIISDNGTNFVGAKAELEDVQKLFNDKAHQDAIISFCATKSIEWKFIPPRGPNFGGLWESGVKSVKFHLKRIAGSAKYDYEELYSILVRIEGILNSRPITPASADCHDLEPLTPGHFLIFRPINAVPKPDYTDKKESTIDRWARVTKVVQHFWQRWHSEYLCTLQQRYKWHKDVPVSLGLMVIVKEDNLPPLAWLLGRIVNLVTGSDGLVRVVDVRTKNGVIRRPLNKLCFLPILDNAKKDD